MSNKKKKKKTFSYNSLINVKNVETAKVVNNIAGRQKSDKNRYNELVTNFAELGRHIRQVSVDNLP